jgi:ABC-2 type transport system permease protein
MALFSQKSDSSAAQHQKKQGTLLLLSVAVSLFIATGLYLLIGLLPASIRNPDLTSKKVTEVSDNSKNFLSGIEEKVTIWLICLSGEEDTTISRFLESVSECSPYLSVQTVDPAANPAFVAEYCEDTPENNSILVVGEKRYRLLDVYDLYSFSVYNNQSGSSEEIGEYSYLDFYTLYTNYSAYFSSGIYTYEQLFQAENAVVSAIDYVTADTLPVLYCLSGHGESDLPETLLKAFELDNLEVQTLLLPGVTEIPADADGILINAPTSDLSESEEEILATYLENGGNLFLFSDSQICSLSRFSELLASYGLSAQEGYLYETNPTHYKYYQDMTLAVTDAASSYLGLGGYAALFIDAHPILIAEENDKGVSYISIFQTSETARFYNTSDEKSEDAEGEDTEEADQSEDEEGQFSIGVIAHTDRTHILWISSSYYLDSDVNTEAAGGNYIYFTALAEQLCGKSNSLSIASKSMVEDALVISTAQAVFWTIILTLIIPCTLILIGLIVTIRRKRR